MSELAKNKVILKNVRLSYCHLWEPHSIEGEDKKKFSVSIIIPKSDKKQIKEVKAAIEAAKELGKGNKPKWKGKVPGTLRLPLRDGDTDRPEDSAYENSYFINANSNTRPGIVDKNTNPIMDQDEVYSGCYGAVSVTFYPYETPSNGVAAGLNHVMKLKDGEPLGGRSTAEADFADLDLSDLEDDDDDDDMGF